MKTTIRLYIHKHPDRPQEAIICNMAQHGARFGVLIGTQDIEVEWEEIEDSHDAVLIEQLEASAQKVHEDARLELSHIAEQIEKLRSAEYKPEAKPCSATSI